MSPNADYVVFAIFVMLVFLAALVTLWYPLEGWDWGCWDSISMLACRKTFLVTSSLLRVVSWPVCKT